MRRSAYLVRRYLADTIPFYVALGALLGTFCIHLLALVYRSYLNHDVAFNLTAGKMTWQGALPFVGVVDINPPMIMYLNAIPAAISSALGISLPVVGLFFFFFLVLLTGWVFTESLALNIRLFWTERFVIWTFWLWLSLWMFQNDMFGQREQLILFFLTPFVCLRHARYAGVRVKRSWGILLGVLAFLALSMKPQYVLPLALAEGLFFLFRKKTLRPLRTVEVGVIAILSVAYLLHFYLLPGMSAFYTVWTPFGLKGYSAFSQSKRILIYNLSLVPYILVYLGGATLTAITPLFCRRRFWLVVSAVGWFSLGSLAVCIHQAKGWEYHRLPFLAGSLLAVFLAVFYFVRTSVFRSYRKLILSLGGVGLFLTCSPEIVTLLSDVREKQPFQFPQSWVAELITSLTEPDEAVVIQGTSVSPTFSALTYTNRPYGSRFLTGYPVVFIFHDSTGYDVPEQWRSEEPEIYRMITEDISRSKPRLFLVRSVAGGQGLPKSFIYSKYLEKKGFFETTLKGYKRIGFRSGFDVYYLPRAAANGSKDSHDAIPYDVLRGLEKRGVLKLDDAIREKVTSTQP